METIDLQLAALIEASKILKTAQVAVCKEPMPDGYTNDWERRGVCVPA